VNRDTIVFYLIGGPLLLAACVAAGYEVYRADWRAAIGPLLVVVTGLPFLIRSIQIDVRERRETRRKVRDWELRGSASGRQGEVVTARFEPRCVFRAEKLLAATDPRTLGRALRKLLAGILTRAGLLSLARRVAPAFLYEGSLLALRIDGKVVDSYQRDGEPRPLPVPLEACATGIDLTCRTVFPGDLIEVDVRLDHAGEVHVALFGKAVFT